MFSRAGTALATAAAVILVWPLSTYAPSAEAQASRDERNSVISTASTTHSPKTIR